MKQEEELRRQKKKTNQTKQKKDKTKQKRWISTLKCERRKS